MSLALSTYLGHTADGDTGSSPAASTESCPWIPFIPTTDFYTTATDDHTIGFFTNQTQLLRDGLPIRVLDRSGVEYGDVGLLFDYEKILGIVPDVLDWEGRLYFQWVSDGGGFWHINLYKNVQLTAASKVGHTASFNVAGDQFVLADNGSGLTGTFNALLPPGGVPDTVIVEFYKWYVAQLFSPSGGGVGGILILNGPPLSTGENHITQCWWSCPARVMEIHDFIAGEIPKTALYLLDHQQEARKWNAANARLVHLHIRPFDVGGVIPLRYYNFLIGDVFTKSAIDGACTSNGHMGLRIPDGSGGIWIETFVDLDPAKLRTLRHDEIEWAKSDDGGEAASVSGLTCEATWVLE